MLPRKWSKIGHGLMLAGVIGLLLELLFWIPNMEVGWKDIAAVTQRSTVYGACVRRSGGFAVEMPLPALRQVGPAAVAVVGECGPVLPALRRPAGI